MSPQACQAPKAGGTAAQLDYQLLQAERAGKCRPQGALEMQLRQIAGSDAKTARAELVRHVNAVQHDDLLSALDNLHHYFDCSDSHASTAGAGVFKKRFVQYSWDCIVHLGQQVCQPVAVPRAA